MFLLSAVALFSPSLFEASICAHRSEMRMISVD
jgi:hypothetical protein